MTDSNRERPEPEGVIMKYPAAVSDRWRFHRDPEYGSETENTERKKVWSGETIRQKLQKFRHEALKGRQIDGQDFVSEDETSGYEAALSDLIEVFSGE